jgi:D-xylose transport system substrate-binding protein
MSIFRIAAKYAIFAACLFALTFCNIGDREKIKVAFLFPNLKGDRYVIERDVFVNKITQLGGQALIADANYDDKLQIVQVNEMMKQGVKVLVVNSVNTTTAAMIVRDAHAAHVKVIAYDRLIQNSEPDFYLSFDNVEVGRLMAKYALTVKPKGNYILLNGDKADKNAVSVKSGILEVLAPQLKSGLINIMYDVFVEDWSGENAYHEVRSILDLTDVKPDAILSSNDAMSGGAIKALEEDGLDGKVFVSGQDAELQACKRIVAGTQGMTVYKSVIKLAEYAAGLSLKIAKGDANTDAITHINNGRAEVPSILLMLQTIDINNLKTTVIADKFYKESDIYN